MQAGPTEGPRNPPVDLGRQRCDQRAAVALGTFGADDERLDHAIPLGQRDKGTEKRMEAVRGRGELVGGELVVDVDAEEGNAEQTGLGQAGFIVGQV